MPDRLIISAATASTKMGQIVWELGRPGGNRSQTVVDLLATSQGTAGSATTQAPGDHRHGVLMGTTVQPVSFTTSTAGVGNGFARDDHVHFGSPGAVVYGGAASNVSWATSTAGVAANASRSDHVHQIMTGVRNTPSRSPGLVYTNTGSSPMLLFVSAAMNATSTMVLQGPVILGQVSARTSHYVQITGIVNADESYYLTSDTGINIGTWVEYAF